MNDKQCRGWNWFALFFALAPLLPTGARAAWVFQESHAPQTSFRAVQAVNAKVVWAGGTAGTCRRTVDGGVNWEIIAVPEADKLDFRGLFAFDERTVGVIMDFGGHILTFDSAEKPPTSEGVVWRGGRRAAP